MNRRAGAEPVPVSVALGGSGEPRRRTECLAGGLLLVFVVDLVLVRTSWPPLAQVDQAWLTAAHGLAVGNRTAVTWSEAISLLGSTPVRWTLVALTGALLWWRGLPRAAIFVVAVELVGTGLNNLLKIAVDRVRPVLDDPVASAPGASFPSGHAMNSTTCYALLASVVLFSGLVADRRRRRWIAGALLVVPGAVGVTRVLLGVHYPSDVVGGWVLGIAFVAGATALVRPWRRDPVAQGLQHGGGEP